MHFSFAGSAASAGLLSLGIIFSVLDNDQRVHRKEETNIFRPEAKGQRDLASTEFSFANFSHRNKNSAQRKISRRLIENKKLLTVCTMIKTEVAYIVEWIEFMRIQGVDRFVIYNDNSTDNITLLKTFYFRREPSLEIHIFEAIGPSIGTITAGLKRQAGSFQHCLNNFGATTQWMIVIDVDEFLYSPAFGTISELLGNISLVEAQENRTINHIISLNLNFGTSGQQHRFDYRLVLGRDQVLYQNGCGIQLLTDHVLRGPHLFSEATLYSNLTDSKGLWICKLPGFFSPCRHNPGKSLFRPADALEAGVHNPAAWRPGAPDSAAFSADTLAGRRSVLLMGNHYYYRSREDAALKASQWHIPEHVRNCNLTDDLLWNRVRDDRLRSQWGPPLARRMRRLVAVGGRCAQGHETQRGDRYDGGPTADPA
jgi:hypothetical protein